jgi:hypothetical protein
MSILGLTDLAETSRLGIDPRFKYKAERSEQTYTGNINIWLDCGFRSVLDSSAEYHIQHSKHQVIQLTVRNKAMTKEKVQEVREQMMSLRVD